MGISIEQYRARIGTQLYTNEKISDLYKDIPIACNPVWIVVCTYLPTYQQLHVISCQPTFVKGVMVCTNISMRCMSIVTC